MQHQCARLGLDRDGSTSGSSVLSRGFTPRDLLDGEWLLDACARAAYAMGPLTCPLPPGSALAAPEEGGRMGVPVAGRRLDPGDDLVRRLRVLPPQAAPQDCRETAAAHPAA
jgi:hypothetical protein